MPVTRPPSAARLTVAEFLSREVRRRSRRKRELVVEIASASTERIDRVQKLAGYLGVPSLRHYLIVHAIRRLVVHHGRQDATDAWTTRIVRDGLIALEPPGIELPLAALFEGLA